MKKRSSSFLKLFLILGITSYFGILFSITSHELGHAIVAYFCNVHIEEMCIGKKEDGLHIRHVPLVKTFHIDPLFLFKGFANPFKPRTLGYVLYKEKPENKRCDFLISIAGSVTTLLLGCISFLFTIKALKTPAITIEKFWVCCAITYWFIYFTACDLIPLSGSDIEHIITLLSF